MRRVAVLLLLPLALFACKKKAPPDETPAPSPSAPPPANAPEEIFDALNPPPPPSSPDLARRGETLSGDTQGPKQAELDAVRQQGQDQVQGCLDALPPTSLSGGRATLQIRYVIGNDGKTSQVVVEGGTPQAQGCARRAFEGLQFPTFGGPVVGSTFSLNYSRPGAAQQAPPDLSSPR